MTTNFYTQLNPFYANDGRGVQYTNLNYKGTDYECPINSVDNTDNIIGEPVFQLMIKNNVEGVSDNSYDISEQFVDFIINTALFHKSIDAPTSSPAVAAVLSSLDNDTLLDSIAQQFFGFAIANQAAIIAIPDDKDANALVREFENNFNFGTTRTYIDSTLPLLPFITKISSDVRFLQTVVVPYVLRGLVRSIKNITKIIQSKAIINYNISDFRKFYKQLILNVLRQEIDLVKNHLPKNTTVNPINSDIFQNVYKYWNNLDNDARKFYMANLIVMQKSPITPGVWAPVYNLDSFPLSADNYRLNFKKSKKDVTTTVFSDCLPHVPSISHKLSFTNGTKTVSTINLDRLSENDKRTVIKIIYNQIYADTSNAPGFTLIIDGAPKKFYVNKSNPIQNQFKLNYNNFFNNAIKFWQIQTKKGPENFEDIYVDVVTNKIFSKDETGLYTLVNNNKVYYDDAKLVTDLNNNCHGTFIKDGTNNCSIVMKCILNNTPQKLIRCLDSIRDEALFDVAKSDIQNINPTIMKNIIKSFGFVIRKETDGVYRPMSYNEWVKSSQINDELKELLKTNKKLNIYLREILNIIRSSPLILNENLVEKQKDYSRINMSVFHNPRNENLPRDNAYDLLLMRQGAEQSIEMPFFVNLQTGGGAIGCVNNSETLKKIFTHLFAQLVDAGKELKDEDKQRILDAIDQVVKLESRLNSLVQEIELYTKLSKMIKESNEVSNIDLSEIHEITTNRQKLDETLARIREKINKNLSTQQSLFQTLIVAQRPLMRFLIG
jgi:hypothetical protein